MDERVLVAAPQVGATEGITSGWALPGKLEPITGRSGSRADAVFHAAAYAGELGFVERRMLMNVQAPAATTVIWWP